MDYTRVKETRNTKGYGEVVSTHSSDISGSNIRYEVAFDRKYLTPVELPLQNPNWSDLNTNTKH